MSANFAPAGKIADLAVCFQCVFKAYCFGKLPCISETVTGLTAHQPDRERRAVPTGPSYSTCAMFKENCLVPAPKGTDTKTDKENHF